MSDEKMLVLRMLEAGKITVDEAVGLLEAIGQGDGADKRALTTTSAEQSLRQAVWEEERRARQAVRAEVARARQLACEAQEEVKAEAQRLKNDAQCLRPEKAWRALGGLLGGGKEFSFKRELRGEFGVDNPYIDLHNTNGRIELGLSKNGLWQLSLHTRVRADDERNAQRIADRLIQVKSDENSLSVQARRLFGQNASINIELLLPQREYEELSIATTNGSIRLEELTATRMSLKTVNGKVTAEKLKANELQASSVNGSVILDGAIERGRAQAANGRITIRISEEMNSQLDVKSVNGAIKVELPEGDNIGYCIEAESTAGSIKHDLPGLMVSEEQKRPGQRKLVAQSQAFAEKQWQQRVRARTVSGSIKINT
ncbi:MAG: DUF4097 domain-containing protein [Firmicutes bacterium]|nr:DUF4097 domain-containing protein [Bacillota bacterium]